MSLTLDLRHPGPRLDLRATLPSGRITAILGPSGSGKTSILRAIAGLLRLEHAVVRVGDETWSDRPARVHLPARRRRVGMVSQHCTLFPHLSALANVETALLHLSPLERTRRARAALALAQIEGFEGRYPRELSGGQKQRVELARALAREPWVLLLDEPFSAVDRTTRTALYQELLRLQEQLATTIVLVTHDVDEAAQLASHLCLLHEGRLLQSGSTRHVLSHPSCEAAARLLDIPNLFDGHLAGADPGSGTVLRWGPHALRVQPPAGLTGSVRWAIRSADVLLASPDEPRGLENAIPVRVVGLSELGTEALVWLAPEGMPDTRLQMRLPLRVLQRRPLAPGQGLMVTLASSDVMLLAQEAPFSEPARAAGASSRAT